MPEIVRNIVKFTKIFEKYVTKNLSQTGSRFATPEVVLKNLQNYYFRFASRHIVALSATPITPSVEEFTDYDSVVVFLHVARAYIAKFFVTSH